MDYKDNSELGYIYEEDETSDIDQGRKWVFRDGAAILGINCIYMLIFRIVISGIYVNIFTAAALTGMIFGLILMTRTRHCRKVLIAGLVLSALPAVVIMIVLFVKYFDFSSVRINDTIGFWARLFDVTWKFLKFAAVIIARAAVIVIYTAIHVFAYIDMFETKAVSAYIKSRKTDI